MRSRRTVDETSLGGRELHKLASGVDLLLLDVDGVLTDGRFRVSANGEETKEFHARDGLGMRVALDAGLGLGLVSGRRSRAVEARALELGLSEVHLGVSDKLVVVREIMLRLGIEAARVGYVGDDLVDVPVMRQVGFAVAVPDADEVVRRHAHFVSTRPGGGGAVREVIELILRARGQWDAVLQRFGAD